MSPDRHVIALAVSAAFVCVSASDITAQSSPRVLSGCFVVESLDGEPLPLPRPFEILLTDSDGHPDRHPEAVTSFPATAEVVSPRQVRGTWMGRSGRRRAFFEFSTDADRMRGTIWLDVQHDSAPRPVEVQARPTTCPAPTPPI
jgi:hypothetical protein